MNASLLLVVLFLPAQTVEPAAMVLTVKGKVAFERDKDGSRRLGAMTLLVPGDHVRIAEKGEVTVVFLSDGHRERIKANATVSAKGCQPAAAVERSEASKLSSANLESLRSLAKSSRGAVGVLRVYSLAEAPAATPPAVTPFQGATIVNRRPTLAWADAKAEAYLVQVFSGAQGRDQRPLWKAVVNETRLTYPDKEKPLEPGRKFRWSVTPLKGEDASANPIVDSKFFVATKEEIGQLANLKPLLASKDAADLLLAAVSYEAHGVHEDALRLYERLAEMSPDEVNYQDALADYYHRAGRKDSAEMARAKAKKLRADESSK